jgi:hypothetical protein
MTFLQVEMQSKSIVEFASLLTEEEGAVDCWRRVNESMPSLHQMGKTMVRYLETDWNGVGYTHDIFPLKTLISTFFDKRTATRIQKLNGHFDILRSQGHLAKVADGLMVTITTFLVWTIAYAETIQSIGLQPSSELQKAQNIPTLQIFRDPIAQKLFFFSTSFPIRFSENRLYGQNNAETNAGVPPTSKEQLIQWIKQRCYDLGFHERSYADQAGL